MKKNSKVKFYFFIILTVSAISIIYLRPKSFKNVHTESASMKIAKTKKKSSNKPLDISKVQTKENSRSYKAIVESYLVNAVSKEDENGTQWRSLNRGWLKRLELFLEQKTGSKQEARQLLMQYFSIEENHRNSAENNLTYEQYDLATKEYLNLNRKGNLAKKEKQAVSKRFKRFESKIKELDVRLSEKKKLLFKNHYDEILELLKEYNKEISDQHIHLGYSIGFRI